MVCSKEHVAKVRLLSETYKDFIEKCTETQKFLQLHGIILRAESECITSCQVILKDDKGILHAYISNATYEANQACLVDKLDVAS